MHIADSHANCVEEQSAWTEHVSKLGRMQCIKFSTLVFLISRNNIRAIDLDWKIKNLNLSVWLFQVKGIYPHSFNPLNDNSKGHLRRDLAII